MEKFKAMEVRPGVYQLDAREAAINQLIDENEKLREAIRWLAIVCPPMHNRDDLYIQNKINDILN